MVVAHAGESSEEAGNGEMAVTRSKLDRGRLCGDEERKLGVREVSSWFGTAEERVSKHRGVTAKASSGEVTTVLTGA